jgi:glutaminyl-peptide cyclotransferase
MTILSRIPRFVLAVYVILLLSCCHKNAPQNASGYSGAVPSVTHVISPKEGTIIHCGDSLKIELSKPIQEIRIDSVVVREGKNPRFLVTQNPYSFYWHAGTGKVGQVILKIIVYYNDSLQESHAASLVVLSNIVPKEYSYQVVRKYPHDADAYTQGLVYENGLLYESTGLEGKSSLRIVNISDGKPEKSIPLDKVFFGEGIALFKDQIYQITYKSQVGFVYDKKTLEQIRSFDYQIKEGWGLTTDGNNLVMSDGSSQLYFIEPEYFTQVDRVEVFDNKGMIPSLNELEFIHGKILANVYGESYIVIIDPLSGKVLGKLDLHKLMPKGFEGDMGKVLNGIAFNPQTGHLFITGKDWPVLYELVLTPPL